MVALTRDKTNCWMLKTLAGTSEYTMTAMLKHSGGWVELGGADEQKPAREGTVEAWVRSPANPIGGWHGLKKGLRRRFGVYMPPLLEALGLCELEHQAKNDRMRTR